MNKSRTVTFGTLFNSNNMKVINPVLDYMESEWESYISDLPSLFDTIGYSGNIEIYKRVCNIMEKRNMTFQFTDNDTHTTDLRAYALAASIERKNMELFNYITDSSKNYIAFDVRNVLAVATKMVRN